MSDSVYVVYFLSLLCIQQETVQIDHPAFLASFVGFCCHITSCKYVPCVLLDFFNVFGINDNGTLNIPLSIPNFQKGNFILVINFKSIAFHIHTAPPVSLFHRSCLLYNVSYFT